jgi:hypothetical protein
LAVDALVHPVDEPTDPLDCAGFALAKSTVIVPFTELFALQDGAPGTTTTPLNA